MGRKQDDAINPELIALPVAWVKPWTNNLGKTARVFHTTMGSGEDYRNAGLRRLNTNAAYWCLEMEQQIDPGSCADIAGTYEPLSSGFDYARLKVVPRKPSFHK